MPSGAYPHKKISTPFDPKRDLSGKRFNRLTVGWPIYRDRGRNIVWLCACDCGKLSYVRTFALKDGSTASCGCLQKEVARETCIRERTTHGMSDSVEYSRYQNAKGRCEDPKDINYKNYGANGVEFRFKSFEEFYAALGPWPGGTYEVDRMDPFGHYEKGNVRWLTKADGANNKRKSLRLPVDEICSRRAAGEPVRSIATSFKTSTAYIYFILRRELRKGTCLNPA